MSTQMNTVDLIAALEAKRPEAIAFDREQLKAHQQACKEAATARRAYLRELIKLPDAKLAERSSYDRDFPEGASCPMSKLRQLDNELTWLKRDQRKMMTIDTGDAAGRLLAWSADPGSETVCD